MTNFQDLLEEQADQELDETYTQTDFSVVAKNQTRYKKLNTIFSLREIFDRIGYGLGAHQFINILFFLTGAGALVVGVVNAFRDIFSDFFASFIKEFSHLKSLGKNFISRAAIIFGFSFLGILLGIRLQSTFIFALAILLGSVGVVAYGHLHVQLLETHLRHERRNKFLQHVSHYGLLITLIAFLLSGFLLEYFGMTGEQLTILGLTVPVVGYFIVLELAAIFFIISGFILGQTTLPATAQKSYSLLKFFKEYFRESTVKAKYFFSDRYSSFLFLGSLLISVVHTLSASFYGYIIYTFYLDQYAGGFLNVAIVFGIAILVSFLGPWLTRVIQREAGLAPMFVFGTLLMAIMPLTLLYNPHFYAVVMAASLAILGSSILGVAQSMLTHKLLGPSDRATFFTSLKVISTIPFLLLVTLGAYLAYASGFPFTSLLQFIILLLVGVVTPLYLWLVIISQRKKL
jgi:hypothetical protein